MTRRTSTRLLGVLLAGGKSARMGRDKSTLIDQTTRKSFAALAIEKLNRVCDDVVILGHGRGCDERILRIEDPMQGPHIAITHLLQSVHARALLILPIDMPFVDVAMLENLVCIQRDQQRSSVCVDTEGTISPFPLCIDHGFAEGTFAHLPVSSMMDVLSKLDPVALVTERLKLCNLNTPGDVEEAYGHLMQ